MNFTAPANQGVKIKKQTKNPKKHEKISGWCEESERFMKHESDNELNHNWIF